MQRLLFAVYGFHLALQTLHSIYQVVQGGDCLGCVLAGQGCVGCGFEGREDVLVLSFDVLLNGFEVLSGKFMWEAKEGLILFQDISLAGFQVLRALSVY